MPGITGIIGAPAGAGTCNTVKDMVAVMRREKFLSCGECIPGDRHAAVGWAVHAGGFADGNPFWNEARDICLIAAGEEFAEASEIESLRARGHQFDADDASYLVHWYEELGPGFVEKLNGPLCGVLVDLRANRVVLFNDRFGLSRIYVHETGGRIHFASEAKSLLRALPETRRLNPQSLAEYASCGCVLQQRTLFSGIHLLPPASRWIFDADQPVRKETYFTPAQWESLTPLDEAEYYSQLRDTFRQIAPKYFRGRQKIGVSLTGGLDGRMIMACQPAAPGGLPCYTFASSYRDCTDVTYGRAVARACGQPHQIIAVGEEMLGRFGDLATEAVYLSDGTMDVTGAVELYTNRIAREIAPVRMTGNYGSEILRFNVAFKAQPVNASLFSPEFQALGHTAVETYRQEASGNRLSLIASKQVPWHHHSRLSLEQSQLTMRSPYLDNALVKLAYRTPRGQEFNKTPALRFISESMPALGRIPTDRGLSYPPTPGWTKLLHFYQEFSFRAEYAYDYGMPPWLARADHFFAPLHLERLFLGRHKFYHFRVWYRDRLGKYLKDVLLDPATGRRAHLNPSRLEPLVNEHLAGTHNHTTELHQALSMELIHRQLVERTW
jgi:asparagine synthase (glutamine-hydrolysing)